ncbi:MAG: signal recognition particle-docking protein FtsY [Planctomycetota bacterium]
MGLFKSAFKKLTKGLTKTRDAVAGSIGSLRSVLLGRRVDEALIEELETRLIAADVGVRTATRLAEGVRADYKAGKLERGEEVLDYLKRELKALWPDEDRALRFAESGPTVILVTGINGVGKTTTIAKLCRALANPDEGEPRKVLLGACDTFRAGAVRQLEVWAERLGVEVIKGQQGGDPAAVAFDACSAAVARGVDVLILDTAGRLQTQDPLMRQLEKIRKVAERQVPGAPHETLLVLDATSGQNAVRQAEAFGESAGVTGIVLSKLDGTAKGGVVVAVHGATGVPVKFVGVGETPDDLEPFDPEAFVEAMFAEGE